MNGSKSSDRGDLRFRLLTLAARSYVDLDRGAMRVITALRSAAGGWLAGSLTTREAMRLTVALYENRPLTDPSKGLFDWERAWYRRVLPPAPARILVAAAGSGREVVELVRDGYLVDAFEPNTSAVAVCRQVLPASAIVLAASYEDLVAAVLEGQENPCTPIASRRYDAVVMGWGSLTHVLHAADRSQCIAACHRLCPTGPLLASYWSRVPAPSRLFRLSRAFSSKLRSTGSSRLPDALTFTTHAGFCIAIEESELEAVAATIGRRFQRGDGSSYGHGTFLLEETAAGSG